MKKSWKFPLGTRVSFDRRYMRLGWVDPDRDDPRVTISEESGFASVPRWQETKFKKPMVGIVAGVRKITLRNLAQYVGDGEYEHWETVKKELEGQVYIVAVNMSRQYKVAEPWMVPA